MKIDPDNPKLTAYILGELDEKEAAEIESILSDCEESRKYVDSLRSTVQLLTDELSIESVPGLSTEQKDTIEKTAATESYSEPVFIDQKKKITRNFLFNHSFTR